LEKFDYSPLCPCLKPFVEGEGELIFRKIYLNGSFWYGVETRF
jgi:hypothetical protein